MAGAGNHAVPVPRHRGIRRRSRSTVAASSCISDSISNHGIRDWPEVLATDEVMAIAVFDRLLHRYRMLDIKDRSNPRRDLERTVRVRR